MNWSAWGPTLITVLTVIFGAGKIYGRIGSQEIVIARHNEDLKTHGVRLDGHDIELAKAAAFRDGYQMGKKEHGARS